MQNRIIHFYFDYLSGYAYFAWLKIKELAEKRELPLTPHPVLFAGLLNHWGHVGPAEIPPKREWVYKDGFRYAALHGIHFEGPKFHPFNPLLTLRLSLLEVAGDKQKQVIDALWNAGWGNGIDLGSEKEIITALETSGFDAQTLIEKVKSPLAKETLKTETEKAIAQGAFGVPTIIIENELFWGSDRFEQIELYLDGKDPLDHEKLKKMLARPRGADRIQR